MKKILIIGAGAMGAAFTFPCTENNHKVTLTEPYNTKLLKTISTKKKISSFSKNKFTKKISFRKIFNWIIETKMGLNSNCSEFNWDGFNQRKFKTF